MEQVLQYVYQFILENSKYIQYPISIDILFHLISHNGWDVCPYSKLIAFQDKFQKNLSLDLIFFTHIRKAFTLIPADNKAVIFYDDKLSLSEKTFILTHEIAHIILHNDGQKILGYHENFALNNTMEHEADRFALEFLAPTILLKKGMIKNVAQIVELGLLDAVHAGQQMHNLRKSQQNYFKDDKYARSVAELYHSYVLEIIDRKPLYNTSLTIHFFMSTAIFFLFLFSFIHVSFIRDFPPDTTIFYEYNSARSISCSYTGSVYVTKHGDRYHLPHCRYIRDKQTPLEVSIEKAERSGYLPCQFCCNNLK